MATTSITGNAAGTNATELFPGGTNSGCLVFGVINDADSAGPVVVTATSGLEVTLPPGAAVDLEVAESGNVNGRIISVTAAGNGTDAATLYHGPVKR